LKKSLFIFLLFSPLLLVAQDTLLYMQYNLLNYGNYTSYCTTSNNNINNKDTYLQTIFSYIRPDILTVNEMAGSNTTAQRLLYNTLNCNGTTIYSKADYVNTNGSDLVSALYYNNLKIGIVNQYTIPTTYRDILIYKLFYKSPQLAVNHDTIFFVVIAAHLKAGSSTSDMQERAFETTALMNYLGSHSLHANRIVSGDFNLYGVSEQAYQNLINHSNTNIRFYDPVNKAGEWNGNSFYAPYHTQSTHTYSNDCFASGGLDDRFDFILVSQSIMNGIQQVQCLPQTYKAIGNDGLHFNDAIIDYPVNNNVPSNVLDALYNMSDHLPVTMKIKINPPGTGIDNPREINSFGINFSNPVQESLSIKIQTPSTRQLEIKILAITGQEFFTKKTNANPGENLLIFSVSSLKKGIYLLKVSDGRNILVKKLVKE